MDEAFAHSNKILTIQQGYPRGVSSNFRLDFWGGYTKIFLGRGTSFLPVIPVKTSTPQVINSEQSLRQFTSRTSCIGRKY